MKAETLTEVARAGYTIWRGSFRGFLEPPHWDDLTERERNSYLAVAAYAKGTGGIENARSL